MTTAAVVAVGDELLAGSHPDLNSPEIARRLASLGIALGHVAIVGDAEVEIAGAVRAALERAELVVVTGGLGPTLDDRTRHGVARALERELIEDPAARADLVAWFEHRGTPMPEANLRQALFPRGAELVRNRMGTAPGFRVEVGERALVCLPGPPAEMSTVLAEEVLPWLVASGRGRSPLAEHRFYLFGLAESVFAERVGDWMAEDAEPRMGVSAKKGVLSVVFRAGGASDETRAELDRRVAAFRERFRPYVFSEEDGRLEQALGRALLASGTTIGVAESCTGGMVASLLTRVPGISAVFERAFVAYSNEAKAELLGVEPGLIERHGAVSPEVAEAMARGVAGATGARLTCAVTGIAGPEGGSPEKPVGLVWFATALDGDVRLEERRYPPGWERDWIRTVAARTALFLCLRRLDG